MDGRYTCHGQTIQSLEGVEKKRGNEGETAGTEDIQAKTVSRRDRLAVRAENGGLERWSSLSLSRSLAFFVAFSRSFGSPDVTYFITAKMSGSLGINVYFFGTEGESVRVRGGGGVLSPRTADNKIIHVADIRGYRSV